MQTYRVRGTINILYEHEYVCEECGQEAHYGDSDTLKINKRVFAKSPEEARDNVFCVELAAWQEQHWDRFYIENIHWASGDPQTDLVGEDVLMRMLGAPMFPQLEGL
jgi:hypothetical protein